MLFDTDFQDSCEDSPCGGGRCLDSYYAYYCDCDQGFTGDQCQIGKCEKKLF